MTYNEIEGCLLTMNSSLRSKETKIPYVPTPFPVAKRMLQLAAVKQGKLVCDLGAGDGRLLSLASQEYSARAVGIELSKERHGGLKRLARVDENIEVLHGDMFQFDISKADVLLFYLTPEAVSLLEPKLETGLKPTARVVSHDYPIKGLKPVRSEMLRYNGEPHFIYVYAPRGLADTQRRTNQRITAWPARPA